MRTLLLFLLASLLACSCKPLAEDRNSAFAMESGDKTILLGASCSLPINKGYAACQLSANQEVPSLSIFFMNEAQYAVSDCRLGILESGAVTKPGELKISLARLRPQLDEDKFCLIKIEAYEKYPDPRDETQIRTIPLGGLFFVERLGSGYIPKPSKSAIGWCAKVGRTTKGRTYLEALDPEECD